MSGHRQWPSQNVSSCELGHHSGPNFDPPGCSLCEGIFLMLERFKFIGFGFATADPSVKLLSRTLFDMAHCFLIGSERNVLRWLQENTGKFMMCNKRRRRFHSSCVKFPLVNMYASWIFGVNIFDFDLGVQVDSVKQTS